MDHEWIANNFKHIIVLSFSTLKNDAPHSPETHYEHIPLDDDDFNLVMKNLVDKLTTAPIPVGKRAVVYVGHGDSMGRLEFSDGWYDGFEIWKCIERITQQPVLIFHCCHGFSVLDAIDEKRGIQDGSWCSNLRTYWRGFTGDVLERLIARQDDHLYLWCLLLAHMAIVEATRKVLYDKRKISLTTQEVLERKIKQSKNFDVSASGLEEFITNEFEGAINEQLGKLLDEWSSYGDDNKKKYTAAWGIISAIMKLNEVFIRASHEFPYLTTGIMEVPAIGGGTLAPLKLQQDSNFQVPTLNPTATATLFLFNAGCGDAAIFCCEDVRILIDTGIHYSGDRYWTWLTMFYDYLNDPAPLQKVLIVTHGDEDHMSGLPHLRQHASDFANIFASGILNPNRSNEYISNHYRLNEEFKQWNKKPEVPNPDPTFRTTYFTTSNKTITIHWLTPPLVADPAKAVLALARKLCKDTQEANLTPPNLCSLAFVVEITDPFNPMLRLTFLFTGDAPASAIVDGLQKHGFASTHMFDYADVPHHGSSQNRPTFFFDNVKATKWGYSWNEAEKYKPTMTDSTGGTPAAKLLLKSANDVYFTSDKLPLNNPPPTIPSWKTLPLTDKYHKLEF